MCYPVKFTDPSFYTTDFLHPSTDPHFKSFQFTSICIIVDVGPCINQFLFLVSLYVNFVFWQHALD